MRAEWDEWQGESAVSLASDGCAGCPGSEGSHTDVTEKELTLKGIIVPSCNMKITNRG